MSLNRLKSRGTIVGGASAIVGWAISEYLAARRGQDRVRFDVALTCGLVGGAIGVGLNLLGGMANTRWRRQARRIIPGLVAGGFAGAIGGSLGEFASGVLDGGRVIGWTLMGAGIGSVEGLSERSPAGVRDGLIGGTLGGLAGGLLFDPIRSLWSEPTAATGRAAAFAAMGMCVGFLIGTVKVTSCRAWLTVIGGYRPGRLLILSGRSALLGRSDDVALPIAARGNVEVDQRHARVVRLSDGRFALDDNHSRHGTSVNRARVLGRVILADGDLIEIGGSSIRFQERRRRSRRGGVGPSASTPPASAVSAARPPVPPRPLPAATRSPGPTHVASSTPKPATTPSSKEKGRPLPGMSPCPKCGRPVPGTRPYCVVCRISF